MDNVAFPKVDTHPYLQVAFLIQRPPTGYDVDDVVSILAEQFPEGRGCILRTLSSLLDEGSVTRAQDLLESYRVHVDSRNQCLATPLMLARTPAMVRLLLKHGADKELTDCYGDTALIHKARALSNDKQHQGDIEECIRVLIEDGADPDKREMVEGCSRWTALVYAVVAGHSGIVDLLLAAGADPHGHPVYMALHLNRVEIFDRMMEKMGNPPASLCFATLRQRLLSSSPAGVLCDAVEAGDDQLITIWRWLGQTPPTIKHVMQSAVRSSKPAIFYRMMAIYRGQLTEGLAWELMAECVIKKLPMSIEVAIALRHMLTEEGKGAIEDLGPQVVEKVTMAVKVAMLDTWRSRVPPPPALQRQHGDGALGAGDGALGCVAHWAQKECIDDVFTSLKEMVVDV